ncbi:MAG: hypothetical protein BGO01_05220 [Armatimonadetes bacterium 55-13]|nr:vitamin K epoxide reductase family protein [Armatimonadota bacterium]ODU53914.1 MAG: hypothetical protein ABT09_00790 [bacterium SCN 57-13]OJU61485.1 MAG: hypothetical protein BGO01_05220 [Armatimonadetes bacterium 55-13]
MSAVALNRILIALGFIGIFIAGYLSLSHVLNIALPCGVSHGCDIVATHPTSYLIGDHQKGGIPVAYLGFVGYVILAALAIIRGLKGMIGVKSLVVIGFVLSGLGAIYSGYLTYIALYEIKATCIWCLSSAITMVLTTITYAALMQTDLPQDSVESSETRGRTDMIVAAACGLVTLIALGMGPSFLRNTGAKLDPGAITKIVEGEVKLIDDKSHILGQKDAPITIVEFADLLCPGCKGAFPKVEKLVTESGGKVRVVFHHFPLFMKEDHRMAMPAATIAEMAGEEGKFWDFLTAMYAHSGEELQSQDAVLAIAKSVGLDPDKAKKRLEDAQDPALARVVGDINLANELKINQTPTFFLMAEGEKPKSVSIDEVPDLLKSEPYNKLMSGGTAPASK